MEPKTAIVIVVLAGGALVAYSFYRRRQLAEQGSISGGGALLPGIGLGFDFAATPINPRTSDGHQIVGTAVPRTCPDGYTFDSSSGLCCIGGRGHQVCIAARS